MAEAKWYVIHTFSGYEKKVQTDLEKTIENRNLHDKILEIKVPMEEASRFGILNVKDDGEIYEFEEKPKQPKSNYAVPGLYFYSNDVVNIAANVKPSARGELEITDLNRIYLEKGELNVKLLGQGFTWLDTGTHESLVEATNFVYTIETHQHRKIACLEEIAYRMGFVSKEDLLEQTKKYKNNEFAHTFIFIITFSKRYIHL
mgnify:CR=1 FL=1